MTTIFFWAFQLAMVCTAAIFVVEFLRATYEIAAKLAPTVTSVIKARAYNH